MKSALFVDFDNVYSGLRRLDPAAADRFAWQPLDWIEWLTNGLPAPPHAPEGAARRLLVRRCYLNPQVYQRFRPPFNRAGFEIIDCPAMTSEGKTSTDIHMVLDIVELLQHQVQYDEFIAFSADADFTPVLRKLRRWDRRTTVLAIGFPSAAYQASADLLIDQDEFVRKGLGFEEPEPPVPSPGPPPAAPARSKAEISREVSDFIVRVVAAAARPVALPWIASRLPAEVAGLDPADRAGFTNFKALIDSLRLDPLVVRWDAGLLLDPMRHAMPERSAGVPRSAPAPGGFAPEMSIPEAPLRRSGPPAPADWGRDQDLWPVVRLVHSATGLPLMLPSELSAVFAGLAADLAQQPFQLSETGKRVRDRCRDGGHAVSRSDVSFVLKGIQLGGHPFGTGTDDPRSLAQRFIGSVLELCRREQVVLDEAQVASLREWATRGMSAP
jgi:hypothetical protein